ncbi:MAG TPA: Crp/Fnr family transcriptional regulator [Abditibacteriaceae bacterium]|nr:Crp/Fnr family transcriptional regulator [Abditibacteriaceae bacterium]
MLTINESAALREIALFRDLTDEQLAELSKLLYRRKFPGNTYIFSHAQPGEVVYFVHRGTIKIQIEQSSGKNVILNIVGAGEVLGEMAVIDGLPRTASALTLEPSVLFWMDRDDFLHCLKTVPALAFNLTRIFSRRLRLASERIQMLATLDVPGKVAHQLLALARLYGVPAAEGGICIPIHLTQDDLADLVGAKRPSVSPAIVDFKKKKYITVDTKCRITVLDVKGLAEYLANR